MAETKFNSNKAFRQGLEVRRKVLGAAHVERSLNQALQDPFLLPVQQMVVEVGWGQVWSRPGLPLKTRSFLALAFLAALGKHDELRTHIRGAVNNGASREEIAEVFLQAGVYCGMPVSLECFRIAKEVLDELESE